MLSAFRWDSKTGAIPAWAYPPTVLFYDKQAFDRAGLAYPSLDWDREDFLAAARQLTLRERREGTQCGFVDRGLQLRFAPLMTEALSPDPYVVPALDTPEVAEAVRWYTDLTLTEGVMPNPYTLSAAVSYEKTDNFYWEQWSPEEQEVLGFALDHALVMSWIPAGQGLVNAVDDVWQGESVEEALEQAQQWATAYYTEQMGFDPRPVAVAPADGEANGVIQITFAASAKNAGLYRDLAGTFNTQQSGIYVDVARTIPIEDADCFVGSDSVIGKHNLLSLQPFVDDSTLDSDDLAFVDAFREQSDLFGLPAYADAAVLFYNADLFDAAKLDYPDPGWDLDDFLQAAKALTFGKENNRQYGYLPLGSEGNAMPLFVTLRGTSLWDAGGAPRFSAPDAVEAVIWYTDLALEHEVMPITEDVPNAPMLWRRQAKRQSLVTEGRVAMWTGRMKYAAMPSEADVGIAPLPGNWVKFYPVGLFISADTPHAAACRQWLTFATTHAPVVPDLGIPAYRPALTSERLIGDTAPETISAYQALQNAEPIHLAVLTFHSTPPHLIVTVPAPISGDGSLVVYPIALSSDS